MLEIDFFGVSKRTLFLFYEGIWMPETAEGFLFCVIDSKNHAFWVWLLRKLDGSVCRAQMNQSRCGGRI